MAGTGIHLDTPALIAAVRRGWRAAGRFVDRPLWMVAWACTGGWDVPANGKSVSMPCWYYWPS